MPTGSDLTSTPPPNNQNCTTDGNSGSKLSTISYDPTPYIQRARVTRPAPPKPSVNPMQFVQIKPCNLYQSAQEQLKRAEEVKKVKEVKKEEPEDWQSNLDNWKSSRRKRVEQIIDRVVEVKKFEMEEHDRTRRKSKTFSEMLEERGSRRKLSTLPVYTEDESNDLSDLGIGTSSTSGKSSLSEDCDNHSVMSDNIDIEKPIFDTTNNTINQDSGAIRDYISSPGYDTSSSTAPASSPDPCEYTYEGAIQDYKTRVSRAQSNCYNNGFNRSTVSSPFSKDSTPERNTLNNGTYPNQNQNLSISGGNNKTDDRLLNLDIECTKDVNNENTISRKNVPKIDISKRRQLFEQDNNLMCSNSNNTTVTQKRLSGDFSNSKSIKSRLSNLERKSDNIDKSNTVLNSDINSIKGKLQNLERQQNINEKQSKIDVPVVSLKDRLSSLQNSVIREEIKKPVLLVDDHDLEVMKGEELSKRNILKRGVFDYENLNSSQEILNTPDEYNLDTDREDSGIHTTDVSCSVSQTDEQPELVNEDTNHHHNHEDELLQTQLHIEESLNNCKIETNKIVSNLNDKEQQKCTDNLADIKPDIEQIQITSLESLNDQESSVSLSLSESTNASVQTMVFSNNKFTNGTQDCVDEALDMALQAIDNEVSAKDITHSTEQQYKDTCSREDLIKKDPLYENINEIDQSKLNIEIPPELPSTSAPSNKTTEIEEEEPFYQIPKSCEPYYEVPKNVKPVPVYENIEMFYSESCVTNELGTILPTMEPPKEKPPPPPMEEISEQSDSTEEIYEAIFENVPKEDLRKVDGLKNKDQSIKRINSTKRIKKELRNKRSSFLGIEGSNDDDSFFEFTVVPPPNMAQLLQEERRLEKQLYIKAGLYDSSDTGDSRDSGVSENHSRQSSEPFTSSEEHDDLLGKKEKEIIEVLRKEEKKQRTSQNWSPTEDNVKIQCIEDQIKEQEEVLRVERELLQLEQEELKRQRESLILRKNMARKELEYGAKMLLSANRHSLQDINNASSKEYVNMPNEIYQVEADYRKSMSDLQGYTTNQKRMPPVPPAKPLRSPQIHAGNQHQLNLIKIIPHPKIQHSQSTDEFIVPHRNYQPVPSTYYGNMSRHTLHALSAVPKPKYSDEWIHTVKSIDKTNENGIQFSQNKKSTLENFNHNKHWLVQEAIQRRLDQERRNMNMICNNRINGSNNNNNNNSSAIQRNGSSDNKPLPDAVIQTLTQRVQSKGIGERKKIDVTSKESNSSMISTPSMNFNPLSVTTSRTHELDGQQDKILSVSGKKRCSHCGEELGRGAAMIIESLRLFYHINCFKCCVCHVQLSDGLNGTDVRVRNHKLHCQNCYSSDDGIKFSCV